MKKILEVLQYGEMDIRFNTDIDVAKNPQRVMEIVTKTAFTMMTKLWGGNEMSVIAMIRALAIADLSVSENRKQMIKQLDEASEDMANSVALARKEMEKRGGVTTFNPSVKPHPTKS